MSLHRYASLTRELHLALGGNPGKVAPLLQEMTDCIQEIAHGAKPEKAVVLKVWRQNRALQKMLKDALCGHEPPPLRARA